MIHHVDIDFRKQFNKQLAKSPEKIKQAFRDRIKLFIADRYNPLLRAHALKGRFEGYRSINITGDWRAVFKKMKDDKIIFVAIGTHSQLYKK